MTFQHVLLQRLMVIAVVKTGLASARGPEAVVRMGGGVELPLSEAKVRV